MVFLGRVIEVLAKTPFFNSSLHPLISFFINLTHLKMTKTSDKPKSDERTREAKPAKKQICKWVKPKLFKWDAACYAHKLHEDQESK